VRASLIALSACATLLLFTGAVASAHELQVLDVGGADIDAGTGDPARLVHATLAEPDDELVVTVRATGAPIELQLLVPGRAPELDASGSERPTITLEPAGAASVRRLQPIDDDGTITDAATGVRYLPIAVATLEQVTPAEVTVRVARGSVPTRVALRVGLPTTFEATNVERAPRTFAQLRGWNELTAPGVRIDPASRPKPLDRLLVAWFGAGIALLGVAIAAWWVRSGRTRSRERGTERAIEESRR